MWSCDHGQCTEAEQKVRYSGAKSFFKTVGVQELLEVPLIKNLSEMLSGLDLYLALTPITYYL